MSIEGEKLNQLKGKGQIVTGYQVSCDGICKLNISTCVVVLRMLRILDRTDSYLCLLRVYSLGVP